MDLDDATARTKNLLGDYRARDVSEAQAQTPCVVYECSSDLILLSVSPSSLKLLGIRPEVVLGGNSLWNERLMEEDRLRLQMKLKRLNDSDVGIETHRIKNDRGLCIWVAHNFYIERTGKEAKIHGCIMPLAPDFQSRFIESSIISQFVHKVGNHFQVINLLMGSLRRLETNVNEVESLQTTVDRAVELVQSFSNYSQSVSARERIKIFDLVDSLVTFSGNMDIPVEVTTDSSLQSAVIQGDAFLLEFAFAAVLHNAAEATENCGPVALHACRERVVEGMRPMAKISIRDLGHGVESQTIAKIADPFFTTRQNRHGLGLSSAVRIFEAHGGGVKVSSVKGSGTEVRILLPIENDSDGNDSDQLAVSHV